MARKHDPLFVVKRAATKAGRSRQELDRAIRAVPADVSLRRIAEAAGLSHEQIRRIKTTERKLCQ
jgi:DNA-binding phage protein